MRANARRLFLIAAVSVALLALLSDPAPPAADGLGPAEGATSPVQIVCIVLEVQERERGWTLTLADGHGAQAQAYCPRDVVERPPSEGEVLRLTLAPSGRDAFFFVEGIALV